MLLIMGPTLMLMLNGNKGRTMRVTESLMPLERVIKRNLLGFFVLLSANEVPENWEPEWQKVTLQNEWQTPHRDS